MRTHYMGWILPILVTALTVAACGGSTEAPPPSTPQLAVTGFAPDELASELPTDYAVTGRAFGPVGGTATVRLESVAGTPFDGGTSASIEFPADVESATRIAGTSDFCGVTGSVDVRVAVILEDNDEATSRDPLTTIEGPALTDFGPDPLTALLREFEVDGQDLGPAGEEATLRFTASQGTPFQGGTSSTLEVKVHVDGPTELSGEIPLGAAVEPVDATVTYLCDSGAEAELPGTVTIRPDFELPASDRELSDGFGRNVAISGDALVVGAPYEDSQVNNGGAVYVYRRTGGVWDEEQKIAPSSLTDSNFFGQVLAMDGETVVVGVPGDTTHGQGSGAVYVFVLDAGVWVQEQKIYANDHAPRDSFGISVAIDGDTLVVGATLDDDDAQENSGSTYVFVRNAGVWTQQDKVRAGDPVAHSRFGDTVAVSGARLVVGRYRDANHGNEAGATYVFTRSGIVWSEQDKLYASDAAAGDKFGSALSLDGDTLLVGAWGNDDAGGNSGSAYVFQWDGASWNELDKLSSPDAHQDAGFGHAVAVSGDLMVIGAYRDSETLNAAGAAYVFRWDGVEWVSMERLEAVDAAENDEFGYAVGLSGTTAVVGAHRHSHGVDGAGAAYVY